MDNPLVRKLSLSPQDKEQVGKTVGRLKSIADFFSDAIDAVKDTSVASAIAKAAPWAGIFGHSLAEVVPPVKFAIKLFEGLTKEHDPDALGFLACTLAYQRSVEQAMEEIENPSNAKMAGEDVKARLKQSEPSNEIKFKSFSFRNALNHEFINSADKSLKEFITAIGYGNIQSRQIVLGVHRRFVGNLKSILSNGKLKERFAPFTQLMELGTEEEQAYDALLEHAEFQRWLFEDAPVFDKEPFALAHVYVDTDCGQMSWGEIKQGSQVMDKTSGRETEIVDPFSEGSAKRQSLVDTVMRLIGDKKFDDAIVIQGVAGSGKSTFTLKLCSELLKVGLHPIRVRLRDLHFDQHVSRTLPKALFTPDRERMPGGMSSFRPDDVFLNNKIFDEQVDFAETRICPYLLILDGWDEISISANEGFQVRVVKMLEQIRSTYLNGRRIRVILTGRPSPAVSESMFLLDETPILTIRPLLPAQLRRLVLSLHKALKDRPVKSEISKGEVPIQQEEQPEDYWQVPEPERFKEVIERYEAEFNASVGKAEDGNRPPGQMRQELSGSVAVLGLPLLAYLAVWLMSKWEGNLTDLIANPTTLYRNLVDLTCEKSGKLTEDQIERQSRIAGSELRTLLWRTASAMTSYGKESIAYAELSLRLGLKGYELDRKASEAVKDHVLTKLMISFFFKGGQMHLGAEFVHKSFREYLFAEGIVEVLKEFGREQKTNPVKREVYWKDFDANAVKDKRFQFSRELAKNLAPQWLTPEVADHLEQLIKWEIERTKVNKSVKDRTKAKRASKEIGTPTAPLNLKQWERVRDGLADIWDWWAEGVHLRPQPKITDQYTQMVGFTDPYVQELIIMTAPSDPAQRTLQIEPKRITTMDAHLGDGLFRLCALVHYHVAINSGWLEPREENGKRPTPSQLWRGVSEIGKGPRKCQSLVKQGKSRWTLFAPSGDESIYFANYAHRINSAGWRPRGVFPVNANLSGIDLRGVSIEIPGSAPEHTTIWSHSNLSDATADGCSLARNNFSEVLANGAMFWQIYAFACDFRNSDLEYCLFSYSVLLDANFVGADLKGVTLSNASLENANLKNTNLERAILDRAHLIGSNLENSNLRDARLINANLAYASLVGADLNGALIDGVNFEGVAGRDVQNLPEENSANATASQTINDDDD